MSQKRRSFSDAYSIAPWTDWVAAGALTAVALALGVGHLDDLPAVASALAAVSGIFVAVAVFACGVVLQSESLVLRIARAALPGAMKRSWVSIIFGLMLCSASPVAAMFVAGAFPRVAEGLVLGAAFLDLMIIVRVAWWVGFIDRSHSIDEAPRHRTKVPEWMDHERERTGSPSAADAGSSEVPHTLPG